MSLYLQLPDTRELCSRVLTTKEPRSTFQRRQNVAIYYTVKPAQSFVRCPQTRGWDTNSVLLQGAGVLRNAAACHVSTARIQLFPRLSGQSRFLATTPSLYVPELPAITSAHELQTLETIADTSGIDKLVATIKAHKMEADLNTLLHTHASQIPSRHQTEWYVLIPTSIGVCVILFVVLQFSQPYLIACLIIWKLKRKQENGASDVSQSHPAGVQPKPRQVTVQREKEEASEEMEPQVRFNTYPLQTM
jgi:hypothetical protein